MSFLWVTFVKFFVEALRANVKNEVPERNDLVKGGFTIETLI